MPFTYDCFSLVCFPALKQWVLSASPNVQFLDSAGNVVKSFTVSDVDLTIIGMDSTIIFVVHVRDESAETYTFKKVQVFAQDPSGGSPFLVIDHTLDQEYTKGSSQILELYLHTGVQNVV